MCIRDSTKNAQRIVAVYLVKSAGLIVGLLIPSLLPGTGIYESKLLLFLSVIFLLSSLLCIFGLFTIFIGEKYLSLAASVMIGLGASGIFPLMIYLALNRIQEGRKVLTGLMIATIPIGALFPSFMWAVADSVSIAISFVVPVFCMFYITWIAIMQVRRRG